MCIDVDMYILIRIWRMCTYKRVYVCTLRCIHVCVCMKIKLCMYVYMYIRIYVCMYTRIHVHMHICTNAHMYTCTYMVFVHLWVVLKDSPQSSPTFLFIVSTVKKDQPDQSTTQPINQTSSGTVAGLARRAVGCLKGF